MKPLLILFLLAHLAATVSAQQSAKADNDLLLDYYQNQRFVEALDYLKKIYTEPVIDTKALASLAYTAQMAGRLPDAEGYYQRIYDKDSTNIAILFSMGSINAHRGNNAKAIIFYKKILLKDSTNFNVYKQLATLSQNMGNLPSALTYFQKANTINPVEPDVAFELSTIYINLEVYKVADSIITKALAADTANLLLLRNKAIVNYRLKKFPETIAVCAKLLQQSEAASDVINMLGISYFMVKNYNDCIITFAILENEKAASETSYYYTAMSNKALKDQEKAILYLNKAIQAAVSPNVDSYYNEMGDSYDHLHRLKKAVTAYQKSLLYDTKPVITYYLLGYLYDSELKNKNNAIKYYKKYIKSAPPEKQKNYLKYAKNRLKELTH
jgi:tetratricopeptide (TPR) repeat protein